MIQFIFEILFVLFNSYEIVIILVQLYSDHYSIFLEQYTNNKIIIQKFIRKLIPF